MSVNRKNIANELYDTEISYILSITRAIQRIESLEEADFGEVLESLKKLQSASKELIPFLEDFKKRNEDNVDLNDDQMKQVLIGINKQFENNQQNFAEYAILYGDLLENLAVNQLENNKFDPQDIGTFTSLAIVGIQRAPRYQLLFQDYLKGFGTNPAPAELEQCLKTAEQVGRHINKQKENHEIKKNTEAEKKIMQSYDKQTALGSHEARKKMVTFIRERMDKQGIDVNNPENNNKLIEVCKLMRKYEEELSQISTDTNDKNFTANTLKKKDLTAKFDLEMQKNIEKIEKKESQTQSAQGRLGEKFSNIKEYFPKISKGKKKSIVGLAIPIIGAGMLAKKTAKVISKKVSEKTMASKNKDKGLDM